ncbi:hypothetical protein BB561_002947 [Smittium simulii]|uniref:Uncharacterized protein n=1 Tax=Smittium simulii TaxID=133385 RepID=A0A2T9YNS6_9FUNG|nr:hypothetical protein BB561_002947 [Smittium simulii]
MLERYLSTIERQKKKMKLSLEPETNLDKQEDIFDNEMDFISKEFYDGSDLTEISSYTSQSNMTFHAKCDLNSVKSNGFYCSSLYSIESKIDNVDIYERENLSFSIESCPTNSQQVNMCEKEKVIYTAKLASNILNNGNNSMV